MNTLVFLPGTMCDSRLFAPQIKHFTNEGWQTTTPTINGNNEGIAKVAADLMESLPPKFALVGLSLGGIVALEMLRQQPHRLTHLALLDTNDAADTEQARTRREADYTRAKQCGLKKFMEQELIPRYLHKKNLTNTNLKNTIIKMATDAGIETWRQQLNLLTTRRNNRPYLKTITTPLLIACGESDPITPPTLHEQMAKTANTKPTLFPNSGHLPTIENPASVIEALQNLLNRHSCESGNPTRT